VVVVSAFAVLILLAPGSLVGSGPSTPRGAGESLQSSALVLPTTIQHVIVIFMENANASWVYQNGSYQRYLANHYANASQFYSIEHSSERDYFAATSGTDPNSLKERNTTNLADTVRAAGENWAVFAQSMPVPCDTAAKRPTFHAPSYAYDSSHNPFVWYWDVYSNRSLCVANDVSFSALNSDLARGVLPNYSLVIPDDWNDSHTLCPWAKPWTTLVDCGDSFLRSWLPSILNDSTAPWYRSTAVILTYDEANNSDTRGIHDTVGGGKIYTVVAGACANLGHKSNKPYSTYSLLTTTEWLLGLGSTGHHDSWSINPPMKDLFNPACDT